MVTPEETARKVEELLNGTLKEITGLSADMEIMKHNQAIMAASHQTLALAAKSVADTLAKTEDRQSRLEKTNESLYQSKGVSPNVFFLVTGTLCVVIVLGAIWITDTSVKATLTSFEAGKKIVQGIREEMVEDAKENAKDGN